MSRSGRGRGPDAAVTSGLSIAIGSGDGSVPTPGRLLGQGTRSEVFALVDGRVLKLLLPDYASLADVEAGILSELAAAGVHAPRVDTIVELDGRPGLIFGNLRPGRTLSREVRARPWRIVAAARELAALHAAVHLHTAPGLPSQRERIEAQIRHAAVVPSEVRHTALTVLDTLPDGDAVCHDDVHMLNVIVYPGGGMLIDWALATRGNPSADVATALLQLRFGELPGRGVAAAALEVGRRVFCRAYLGRYLQLRPEAAAEIQRWALPAAVALAGRREGRMRRQLIRRIEALLRARQALERRRKLP